MAPRNGLYYIAPIYDNKKGFPYTSILNNVLLNDYDSQIYHYNSNFTNERENIVDGGYLQLCFTEE
ncbi:MAG: hypothetical protein H7647_07250 [Candidatus Heimdallarchaeota archaeon]|nr:hypothetical protein [Candidatus Heimdallarchaeota archaeon]MCK4254224.1 hypothetical protein [Candidatus Heimdallarchaeota archaeon]